MALKHLDHVNLRTSRLDAMREFYREVLGLEEGPRPAFTFGGAWLYCGEQPVVHLVEVEEPAAHNGGLHLEHFAFAAEGYSEFVQALERRGIPHRVSRAPGTALRQVHVSDPDGNHIHVDFTDPAPE